MVLWVVLVVVWFVKMWMMVGMGVFFVVVNLKLMYWLCLLICWMRVFRIMLFVVF